MGRIIVREMKLSGRCASPADKYYETPAGPIHYDVAEGFASLEKLLRAEGKPVMPLQVRVLPFISEGCVTSNAAVSCYTFGKCIIMNEFSPSFHGDTLIVRAASRGRDLGSMDGALETIKDSMFQWKCYWREEKTKIIRVPETLEDVAQLVPHIPKIFNYHERWRK